jgi:xylulose-5-phosphate/fructose-6-phosphate phosphoketolase
MIMTTAVLTREEAKQSAQEKKPRSKLPLGTEELKKLDDYWRAANFLSVGQIYLYDNPLLKEPLTKEHIKPRLLGHWGTTPGLNFIYAHLNRVIKKYDLDMIYIAGPGHGGPGLVANTYLEGIYSEVYPNISQDEEGMKKLFKQFSFPGGIPSHVAPETPGSIHEGGELGYAVSHAYGAAYDNPNLIVACVVGDGEAETGPLATSWHSNKFLNPATDGVVLPILHLNGYKIANPCVLARISHEELEHLFRGYGYTPYFVEGDDPEKMHQLMAATLDAIIEEIQSIKAGANGKGQTERPLWPMIILRSPKGWTGPKEVDGKKTEGFWRSHQVPMGEMHNKPEHVKLIEEWMKSYRPEELFDSNGRLKPELEELAPEGNRRMGANPHANGGLLMKDLRLPDFRDYGVEVPSPGATNAESTRMMGKFLRDVMKQNLEAKNFRLFSPDENNSNRWQDVLEVTKRAWNAEILPMTIAWLPTAGSWRCFQKTSVRTGWKGTCSPAVTASFPVTRLSSTSSTRCSISTPNGSKSATRFRGAGLLPRSTIYFPATCGGRITTASRTRTRGSSTTSSTRKQRSFASTCRLMPTVF